MTPNQLKNFIELAGYVDQGMPRTAFKDDAFPLYFPEVAPIISKREITLENGLPYMKLWAMASPVGTPSVGWQIGMDVTLTLKGKPSQVLPFNFADATQVFTDKIASAFSVGTGSPSADMLLINSSYVTEVAGNTGLVPKYVVAVADLITIKLYRSKGANGVRVYFAVEQSNVRCS